MINLITGVPGAGKTCYALTFMKRQTKEGRALYVHGIPQLKIPHIDVYCNSPNCDVCSLYTEEDKQNMHPADTWHEWVPDGAVLFFDEVQNIYRPRSSASKPPAPIQAFEVHRHRGLDFYLISQAPKLFDTNIRQLISRHIHLKSNWAGRFQYEWAECKDNVQSTSDAIKSPYKLDSKMFALYKSASLHTKQKRKLPFAVYLFISMIIIISLLGTRIYARINDRMGNNVEEQSLGGDAAASPQAQPQPEVKKTSEVLLDFTPTVKGVLESAPAYATLVHVKDFPKISACISGNNKCVCYTQQLTVYPTTFQQCLDRINRDVTAFNPFINIEQQRKDKQQQQSISSPKHNV